MYRAMALAMTVVLSSACGGDEEPAPPQCPAPQAPVGTLSGTLGGAAFTPAELGALRLGPATCRVGGSNLDLAAVIVGFSSFQGLCTQLQQHGFCWDKANATLGSLQIANAGFLQAQTIPGPGTYPVTIGTPAPDLNGNIKLTIGTYGRTAAACAPTASSDTTIAPAAGTITLDTVTSTSVTGSASLTFTDGSTLAGTFTAPTAPISVDVCQLVNDCTSFTCVP